MSLCSMHGRERRKRHATTALRAPDSRTMSVVVEPVRPSPALAPGASSAHARSDHEAIAPGLRVYDLGVQMARAYADTSRVSMEGDRAL